MRGRAAQFLPVDPEAPFLGTARLEALNDRHLDPRDFEPHGDPPDPLT